MDARRIDVDRVESRGSRDRRDQGRRRGPAGVLNKYVFGTTGETTQRFTFFPNFTDSTGYRSEAEITAQAALNKRLALKFGFLWRYDHDPVPGFKRSDTTTTASIVVRWRSATPAP